MVVTTARERAERAQHPGVPDTICAAEELARQDRRLHLHYPDPAGRKADQLNFVVDHLVAVLDEAALSRSFLLCYDADSRPPIDWKTCTTASCSAQRAEWGEIRRQQHLH